MSATSGSSGSPGDAVVARIKKVYRSWTRATSVEQMRADWDALFASELGIVEPIEAKEVDASWISAPGVRTDKAVLYLHGGGFQLGSTRSHRDLMARISEAVGCRVLGVDYRRAPEHRYPAALDDARAAYAWLLSTGLHAGDIAFAGDSAGGGLVLSSLLGLRDCGENLPAAAAVLSALTDLTASAESYRTCAATDPLHQRPMIVAMGKTYLGNDNLDALHPSASPLFGELHDLPPIFLQVGGGETLLGDSTAFADKARAAGTNVQMEVWDGMIHVFQQFPELPEAARAIASLAAFLRSHLMKE